MFRETKTFQIIEDNRRAAAELSEMADGNFYFNRLIVDPTLRGKGLSIKLMDQVVEWSDTEKVEILLEMNPYGPLDYIQLTQFYERFGFEWKDKEKNLMIRRVKDERKKYRRNA
jgi:GNAT superfamily N-acetyltransferase